MSDIKLGCKAYELTVGTEFSCSEGREWLVVRTEPKYVDEDSEDTTLRFMASPAEKPSLYAWEEVRLNDTENVLLERNWKGGPA